MELYYEHRGEKHRIICIEYVRGIPNRVYTSRHIPKATDGPYDRLYDWDFDINAHWGEGIDALMFYNSGSGGDANELRDPSYIEGIDAKVWLADGIKFKEDPKSVTVIKSPLMLKTKYKKSKNPFEIGAEVSSTCFCRDCDGMVGDSWCNEHMHEGDPDNGEDEDRTYYDSDGKEVEE